ncbi:terpenoid synthase [Ustulina deusta]|nr:terpenoid synthase [Ustulina deusta]
MNSHLSGYSTASIESLHEGPCEDTRTDLVKRIRGSRVRIPDLKGLLSHWHAETFPQVAELEKHVDATLEGMFTDPKDEHRLRKMKASKIGLFTASWFPYASFEALCVIANFYVWLFVWDDETDSFEFSPLIHDLGSAAAFRDQTIRFVRASLTKGKSESSAVMDAPFPISYFESVGAALRESYNDDQIKRFLDEIIFFVEIYASELVMPEAVMLDDSMQIIWHETNIIISDMNDMLSIKKEIVQSQVDSLIPLLFLRYGSVQTAMDQVIHELSGAIGRLEAAERDLLSRYSTAPAETQKKIRHHVQACKLACIANLNWR